MLRLKVTASPPLTPNQRFGRVALFNEDGTPYVMGETPLDLSDYEGDISIDGDFTASGQVAGSTATAGKVQAGDSGVTFGSAEDVKLYRASAGLLVTGDYDSGLYVGFDSSSGDILASGNVWAKDGSDAIGIGRVGPAGPDDDLLTPGLRLNDVKLYRDAAGSLALNGDKLATRPWTTAQIDALIGGAPGTRDTLKEISDQLNADESATAAIISSLTAFETIAHAASTYATQAALASYLTSAAAASTYDTIATAAGYAKTDGSRAFTGNISTSASITATTDLYGRYAQSQQLSIGAMGPAAESGLKFGSANDTNLYRSASGTLKTDTVFKAGGTGAAASAKMVYTLDGSVGLSGTYENEANARWQISKNAGGTDLVGILFGPGGATAPVDALYRVSAGYLQFSGTFKTGTHAQIGNEVYARYGAAAMVASGAIGPASEAAIKFGSAADTNLYRSAADTLKTDDAFIAGGGLQVGAQLSSGVASLYISATATPAIRTEVPAASIVLANRLLVTDTNSAFRISGDGKHEWGPGGASAVDVSMYRDASANLQISSRTVIAGSMLSSSDVRSQSGFAAQSDLGAKGPSSEAGLKFGSAGDTNLYRFSSNTLKTDGSLYVGQDLYPRNIYAKNGTAYKVAVGDVIGSTAGINLGSAGDTPIHRLATGIVAIGLGPGFPPMTPPTMNGSGLMMPQAGADPSTTPTSGGIIYVSTTGALRYRGPAGTDTLIAAP